MDAKNILNPKLGSIEIKNKKFSRKAFGYSKKEVQEFLETISGAWDKMLRYELELGDKVRSLNEELVQWRAKEAELQRLKDKASHEAEGVKLQAMHDAKKIVQETENRASEIRTRTEEWLATIISKVEETERQRQSFVTAFKSALETHSEILKNQQTSDANLTQELEQWLKQLSKSNPQTQTMVSRTIAVNASSEPSPQPPVM